MTRRLIALAACAVSTLALAACMTPAPNPEPPTPPTATTVPGAVYDDKTGARLWTARLDEITGPTLVCMEVESRPDLLACVTAREGVTDE